MGRDGGGEIFDRHRVENGDRLVDVSKPEEETTSHLTPGTPMHVTTSMQSNMQTV